MTPTELDAAVEDLRRRRGERMKARARKIFEYEQSYARRLRHAELIARDNQ